MWIARHGILQSGKMGFTPPLDIYTGAVAAYSIRKLRSAYTGSAIRIRRSSDNTEQDIGFDGAGNLNESALLSFIGSSSAFVSIWYDQSGNGRNATAALTLQPRIANSGTIDKRGTKPAIVFDNINDTLVVSSSSGLAFGPATFYAVSSRISNTTNLHCVLSTGILSADTGYGIFYDSATNNPIYMQSRYTIGGTASTGNYTNTLNINNLLFAVTNNTSNNTWFNGGNQQTSSFTASNTTTSKNIAIGSNSSNNFYLNGTVSEAIIWPQDFSASRSGIESNVNTYYSIY